MSIRSLTRTLPTLVAGLIVTGLLVTGSLVSAAPAAAFVEPHQISSHNGVLKTKFVAQLGDAVVAGKLVHGAITYNGQFPGPTLRVHPGDTIKMTFVNKLEQDTNIHFHGLHVSPSGKADNVLRIFHPGGTYSVVVKIPHDHPNGLYWYHPHLHGEVNNQVLRGLAGMISIEGGKERVKSLSHYRQRLIGLNLTQLDNAGTGIVNPNNENDATATTTVNGRIGQTIKMHPGETELWRIANMSNEGFYKLNLQGHKMWIVGQDGNPTRIAQATNSFVIPPGSRYEVLVKAGHAGSFDFQQLKHSDGFNIFPKQKLLTLKVAGGATSSPPIPHHVKDFTDLSQAKVDVRRKWVLSFSENSDPVFKAYINGKVFDPSRVDTQAKLGSVEEWTFINNTTQDHPIHLHTNDFQVIEVNGRKQRPNAPLDNTILPRNGSIKFRFKPLTYTGLTVFHCHILFHEDSGMMATIRYVKNSTAAKASVVEPVGLPSVHDQAEELTSVLDPGTSALPAVAKTNFWLFCRLKI